MTLSIPAHITPEVIRWAREQAGLDIVSAAKKIGRPTEEVIAWEQNKGLPSLAQARKAAEVYKRSLAVFFLPRPPEGFQTIRDFRRLPESDRSKYSNELVRLIRQLQTKQLWLRTLLEDRDEAPIDFVASSTPSVKESDLVHQIRNELGLVPEEQFSSQTRREGLLYWLNGAERAGINVSRTSDVDAEEARGFALADEYAPFIFVNSDDALAGQLFTLAHELTHLWLGASGVSNLRDLGRPGMSSDDRTEIFCNKVASYLLLDEISFKRLWSAGNTSASLEARVKSVSDAAKVSEEVVARRLLDNGQISVEKYQSLRKLYRERWAEQQEEERRRFKSSKGGPSPHLLRVLRNGKVLTRVVLNHYNAGSITGIEASTVLGTKPAFFTKLARYSGLVPEHSRPPK